MSDLRHLRISSARPGNSIHVMLCLPEGRPRAVLQMTHGMVEYIGRYEELARWLADRGIASVGHDHLGHGSSVMSKDDYGYFGLPDGNRLLLDDLYGVTRWAKRRAELAGAPWFLLGHSMGSFITRRVIAEHGEGLPPGGRFLGKGGGTKQQAAEHRGKVSGESIHGSIRFLLICRMYRPARSLFFANPERILWENGFP